MTSNISQKSAFKQLSLTGKLIFRLATEEDLPKLEWMGKYIHFRQIFRSTYQAQQEGRRLMLLGIFNGFPIGQIFIYLKNFPWHAAVANKEGYLYSLRVMDPFRGMGIGTTLILQAEKILLHREYDYATIAVAKDNEGAKRLYQRLGYKIYGQDNGSWSYTNHENKIVYVHEPSWLLDKNLDE